MIAVALACLVVGIALMLLEIVWLGVILLFAFIVVGVFAVADPAFLAGSGEDPSD